MTDIDANAVVRVIASGVTEASVVDIEANAYVRVQSQAYFVVPVSTTFTISIELLANSAEAGVPGSVLSMVGAQLSRLRADLYDWQVNTRPKRLPWFSPWGGNIQNIFNQSLTDEFIGPKVGTGPILDFRDWQYDAKLSEIGEWTATIPAHDPNLMAAIDGTAKIIKFYLEGIGPILTGWIADHEFDEAGNCTIHGSDLAIFLRRHSSFYRHRIERAWGPDMYRWAAAHTLPATYTLSFGPDCGCDPAMNAFPGGKHYPDNYFQSRRFQNQTIVDMWKEVGMIWGTQWRVNPVEPRIFIDRMGDDSGIVISSIREDDPLAIEQGVLALNNLKYSESDSEIVNCLLPQGSSNSFGVSVELRHSTLQRKFGYYSSLPWSSISFPIQGREDELRGKNVTPAMTENVNFEIGIGAGLVANPAAKIYGAYAQKFSFGSDYHLAWAAAFGYKQVYGNIAWPGHMRLDICPSLANGFPDTDIPMFTFLQTNYAGVGGIPQVNASLEENPRVSMVLNPVTGLFESVFDPGGDKINFSEVIWIPDQIQGYCTVPAGSWWFVISRGFGTVLHSSWTPSGVGTGATTWVVGGKLGGAGTFWKPNPPGAPWNAGTWENQAGFAPLIELSGRYDTAEDRELYPYIIEGQFAEAIDDDHPTSGQRVFFIRDNDSIQGWGIREQVQTFQGAVDSNLGIRDIEPSANTLYASAVTYIERHLGRFKELNFDVVGYFNLPKLGQRVRVVHRGLATLESGVSKWVDIDELFWVMGISSSLSDDGVTHNFKVASVPENLLDPQAISYELQRAINRHNNFGAELEFGTHVGIVRDTFP